MKKKLGGSIEEQLKREVGSDDFICPVLVIGVVLLVASLFYCSLSSSLLCLALSSSTPLLFSVFPVLLPSFY